MERLKLPKAKKCSCGVIHISAEGVWDGRGNLYFNCGCLSTLIILEREFQNEKDCEENEEAYKEGGLFL